MILRRARLDDARSIAAVRIAGWRDAYSHIFPPGAMASVPEDRDWERFQKWIADPERDAFVIEDAEGVAGFCIVQKSRDADADTATANIPTLYLLSRARGGGWGRMLCHEAFRAAAERGFTALTLWVLEQNLPARAFYGRLGFHLDGATKTGTELIGSPITEVRYRIDLRAKGAAQPG